MYYVFSFFFWRRQVYCSHRGRCIRAALRHHEKGDGGSFANLEDVFGDDIVASGGLAQPEGSEQGSGGVYLEFPGDGAGFIADGGGVSQHLVSTDPWFVGESLG